MKQVKRQSGMNNNSDNHRQQHFSLLVEVVKFIIDIIDVGWVVLFGRKGWVLGCRCLLWLISGWFLCPSANLGLGFIAWCVVINDGTCPAYEAGTGEGPTLAERAILVEGAIFAEGAVTLEGAGASIVGWERVPSHPLRTHVPAR